LQHFQLQGLRRNNLPAGLKLHRGDRDIARLRGHERKFVNLPA